MDGQLLGWLYQRLIGVHTAECTYSDGIIGLICLYAAANNRSLRWAAMRCHWPLWCQRHLRWPSYSQLQRRKSRPSLRQLLLTVNAEAVAALGRSDQLLADAKPLVVNGFSKDRDATVGYVPGGFARGYRLNAIRDAVSGVIHLAAVSGLAEGEATVLRPMLRRLTVGPWLIRADANYDSNRLYAIAAARGGRLIAPRRKPHTALGHHPQHPHRLAAIAELERGGREAHRRIRSDIERAFADLSNISGLWALPPFVRRRARVRSWIRAKLLLYHLSLMLRRKT